MLLYYSEWHPPCPQSNNTLIANYFPNQIYSFPQRTTTIKIYAINSFLLLCISNLTTSFWHLVKAHLCLHPHKKTYLIAFSTNVPTVHILCWHQKWGGRYPVLGFAFWFTFFRHLKKRLSQSSKGTWKSGCDGKWFSTTQSIHCYECCTNDQSPFCDTPNHMCSSMFFLMPNSFGKITLNRIHGKQIGLISLQEIGTTYNKIMPNYAWN